MGTTRCSVTATVSTLNCTAQSNKEFRVKGLVAVNIHTEDLLNYSEEIVLVVGIGLIVRWRWSVVAEIFC